MKRWNMKGDIRRRKVLKEKKETNSNGDIREEGWVFNSSFSSAER